MNNYHHHADFVKVRAYTSLTRKFYYQLFLSPYSYHDIFTLYDGFIAIILILLSANALLLLHGMIDLFKYCAFYRLPIYSFILETFSLISQKKAASC